MTSEATGIVAVCITLLVAIIGAVRALSRVEKATEDLTKQGSDTAKAIEAVGAKLAIIPLLDQRLATVELNMSKVTSLVPAANARLDTLEKLIDRDHKSTADKMRAVRETSERALQAVGTVPRPNPSRGRYGSNPGNDTEGEDQ